MRKLKIFIVEDDELYGEILNYNLSSNPDFETRIIRSGNDLIRQMSLKPDVITLDYNLPDISGEKLLKRIQEIDPDLPIIIISGQEDIGTAIDLLKDGAYDYLMKSEDTTKRLWKTIHNIKENLDLKAEVKLLKSEVEKKYSFERLIKGNSSGIQKVFSLIEKACKTNITVSITGETGTGKELVAKAIHHNSSRKKEPFVTINMAAIPSELAESELFGHEKGSFTGAHCRKIGYFEQANNGTIFLDEIGDIDLNTQVKLLRVLQEKEVTRVGGATKVKIDTRLIVATHKNLAKEVESGRFRSDLYYRLLGLPIELPPLRERENDVLLLSKFFIDNFCKENEFQIPSLSKEARVKLNKYYFPGNVRELRAIIELAIVQCDGIKIEEHDVVFPEMNMERDLLTEEKTLKEYNDVIINSFLEKYSGDISLVAEKLNIGKSTIYSLKKSGRVAGF